MANPYKPSFVKPIPMSRPENQSMGILDDFAVRKNVATKEGTIEKVPVEPNDIVNKAYADSLIGGSSSSIISAEFVGSDIVFTKDDATTVVLEDAAIELKGDDGAAGADGIAGPQGPPGADGATGSTGPQGPAGTAGTNGIDGVDGTDGEDGADAPSDGWFSADETWTYSSVDNPTGVFTISGDKTGKYSLGMRIKFINDNNLIYGIITKISYSSPNTTITFLHEIDPTDNQALYLMANDTISSNYFSTNKAPYGFPLNTNKWSIKIKDVNTYSQASTGAGTVYNMGSLSITVPIGLWDISFSVMYQILSGAWTVKDGAVSLSTSASTIDYDFGFDISGYDYYMRDVLKQERESIDLTTKTIYYLTERDFFGGNTIYIIGSNGPIDIRARCSYI